MRRIVLFFIRNRNFLLFFLLFIISLALTINSHWYHKNKFVNSANFLSGTIFSIKSSITSYFNLKEQNKLLHEENEQLRNQKNVTTSFSKTSLHAIKKVDYAFYRANVINNNYSKTNNYLTIDRGKNDSIKIDMGVISSKGIVGIISNTSNNYGVIQSVLNTNSRVVAKFKKSNHFGTLIWDAKKTNTTQLIEIPRFADVTIGDTIVTDGKSTIFPEGIPIGRVKHFKKNIGEDYYNIDVELFTDMSSIKHVYAIKHKNAKEIKLLENQVKQ